MTKAEKDTLVAKYKEIDREWWDTINSIVPLAGTPEAEELIRKAEELNDELNKILDQLKG